MSSSRVVHVSTDDQGVATGLMSIDQPKSSCVACEELVALAPKIDRMLELLSIYLLEKGYS